MFILQNIFFCKLNPIFHLKIISWNLFPKLIGAHSLVIQEYPKCLALFTLIPDSHCFTFISYFNIYLKLFAHVIIILYITVICKP